MLSVDTYDRYIFSDDEKQLMTALGEQCALSIRNAQMCHTIKRRYEDVADRFPAVVRTLRDVSCAELAAMFGGNSDPASRFLAFQRSRPHLVIQEN